MSSYRGIRFIAAKAGTFMPLQKVMFIRRLIKGPYAQETGLFRLTENIVENTEDSFVVITGVNKVIGLK